jgi:hypothetical protein
LNSKSNELGILTQLRAAGFDVKEVSDLFNLKLNYQRAVPVLLHWLPLVADPREKEMIVRALAVKWARPTAARPLVEEWRKGRPEETPSMLWAIGNSLEVVADDSVFDDLVEFARDARYGRARQMVVAALGKMKNPSAVDVLIELLNDEEVAGHALIALQRLAPQKARPHIERFLTHPRTWWRNEAKRALAKIDKKAAL